MEIKIKDLPVHITDIYAEGPPKRQLEISCNIKNPNNFDICILDSWTKISANNGLKLSEGKLFCCMYKRIEPAIIPANDQGIGAFVLQLSTAALKNIEERRAGRDVEISLSSRVLVSEVQIINGNKVLGVPYETAFGNHESFKYTIPQSEWIKMLRNLEWNELELLELPINKIRAIPSMARAFDRFGDAQLCYRREDWPGTMLNCRKIFEAIVQDETGSEGMGKASQAIKSIMGEGKKADCLDKVIKELGTFLHLGRHEQLSSVSIGWADAQLSLHMAGALLAYLGEQ